MNVPHCHRFAYRVPGATLIRVHCTVRGFEDRKERACCFHKKPVAQGYVTIKYARHGTKQDANITKKRALASIRAVSVCVIFAGTCVRAFRSNAVYQIQTQGMAPRATRHLPKETSVTQMQDMRDGAGDGFGDRNGSSTQAC